METLEGTTVDFSSLGVEPLTGIAKDSITVSRGVVSQKLSQYMSSVGKMVWLTTNYKPLLHGFESH